MEGMVSRDRSQRALERTAGPDLDRLFRPRSIAVVGASPKNPWSLGLVTNLAGIGFEGKVAAVNPRYEEVAGVPCYPSLTEVPHEIDAVLIGVRAQAVPDVMQDAAEAGVGAAVVITGGFAEAGPEGRELQDRMAAIAREAGIGVIGPNCQGVININHGSALYMDRIPEPLPKGSIAAISQSGSVLTALLNNAPGITFSHAVSSGNEAVLNAGMLIDYLADDPEVRVIAAFLETIREPERFFAACDKARDLGKPVVVLKVGRTEAAIAAAAAHTGALAAPYRQVDALLRRHGVHQVATLEELLETAAALRLPPRTGRGIAAITLSGGLGELLLDTIDGLDLEFPELEPDTLKALSELGFDHPGNPLDAWGALDYEHSYGPALEALVADPNVEAVVACLEATPELPTSNREVYDFAIDEVARVAATTDKQMAVINTLSGGFSPERARKLYEQGVLPLSGLRQGLGALEAVARDRRGAPADAPPAVPGGARTDAEPVAPGAAYSGLPALRAISSLGIEVVETIEAEGAEAAAEAAGRLNGRVVVKTADPALLHKTDVGGVVTDLGSPVEVARAAESVISSTGCPSVLVQEQARGGVELIVGLQVHQELGPFVMVGLGGVWAEVLDDVAVAPAPLREGEAAAMLERLRAHRILEGVRGEPPVDRAALIRLLEALAAWGARNADHLESVDLNPVFASADGVVAVDAVIVPRAAEAPDR